MTEWQNLYVQMTIMVLGMGLKARRKNSGGYNERKSNRCIFH
jgi:hypothetical protein